MSVSSSEMINRAKAVLAANDRGGYTVPTPRLYPFQWNWDSAFVAMGFAQYDVNRAYRELERLIEGQWDTGLIPHIVFHTPTDTYFPGPDVWQTDALSPRESGGPQASGITQPPVFAIALEAVDAAAMQAGCTDRQSRTPALLEAAIRHHRWWMRARDPDKSGLVSILHPWESGSDNSPTWDVALDRVPTTTKTQVRRKDTGHVDASMRPRDIDYQRFIHLVDTFKDANWDERRMWRTSPFKIACVQMTAILAAAAEAILRLAPAHGVSAATQDEIKTDLLRMKSALQTQYRRSLRRYVSRDALTGADIDVETHVGFMPVLALDLDQPTKIEVEAELKRWLGEHRIGLPTTPRWAASFEPKRYWRGPVWAIINVLIVLGLERNDLGNMALQLRKMTVSGIEKSDFCEYFDPTTGDGLGGHGFSWTAAAYLIMSQQPRLATQ